MMTINESKLITTFASPAVNLEAPAPYRDDRGEKWFPIRAVAEAIGFEVHYSVLTIANNSTRQSIDLVAQDRAVSIPIGTYSKQFDAPFMFHQQEPIRIIDGRAFSPAAFYEKWLNLTVQCYGDVVVFEMNLD